MGMVIIRGDGDSGPFSKGFEIEGDLDTAFTEVRKAWAAGHDIVYVETPVMTFVCDKREPGLKQITGFYKST
jgi:hypothetical protein